MELGVSATDAFAYALVLTLCSAGVLTSRVLDLEEQFSFYASYHQQPINQLIHLACIWPLLWSALVFADASSPIIGALIATIFAAYYIALDRKGAWGLLSAFAVCVCWSLARAFRDATENASTLALGVHIVGWCAQLLGHSHFEKRTPALAENFAQALLMAPHFVLIEACFMLGLRRELADTVRPLIAKRTRDFAQ
ncbi:hypothetical protein T492DRAFT_1099087 [Pavlovales sp. CCMP2436]|nr:hypothetical protein T492DRAFT_1099087 [Pavlovales sp. CCMP2436]|mmetsp:Transcript_43146/g.106545  ORF Transcript_43146/g.106545 Transcript_43146/m.106545 type:complete len:196 (+) Transcript_43146:106-693(+)